MKIKLNRATAKIPSRSTDHAIGYDLHACIDQAVTIPPFSRELIPAGFSIELPPGFVAMICPRSGLALKHGITCLNTPGIIDPDYRGEVGVLLYNTGAEHFTVKPNDRIAQMVITQAYVAPLLTTDELSDTNRGEGGWGSTGVKGGAE